MLLNIVLVVIAYLIGSVSSAVVVCKIMRLEDPRLHGSGNPGATNVLRLHGKKAAALTLAGDMLKGLLPVLIADALNIPVEYIALVAFAAFCGHLFPVFFGFRGGKGVATLIGVLFGMHWILGLAYVITWLVVAAIFRFSSLAGLIAAALSPVFAIWLYPSPYIIASITCMVIILFWRHRSNIKNLIEGKETRIGAGKT